MVLTRSRHGANFLGQPIPKRRISVDTEMLDTRPTGSHVSIDHNFAVGMCCWQAKEEAPQSIRAKFGTDGTKNAAHGSDSPESAARELKMMLNGDGFPKIKSAHRG